MDGSLPIALIDYILYIILTVQPVTVSKLFSRNFHFVPERKLAHEFVLLRSKMWKCYYI